MFKVVLAFICAADIGVSLCNKDTARAVIEVPPEIGCYRAQAHVAQTIDYDRSKEYIKVECRS